MAVASELSGDGLTVTIVIDGQFDYHQHRAFQDAFGAFPKGGKRYVVDLSAVRSIDGSALGMLLQLKAHGKDDQMVRLVNASDEVRQALMKVDYDTLFDIG